MFLFIVLSHVNEQKASLWKSKAVGNKHLHVGCEGFLNCSSGFFCPYLSARERQQHLQAKFEERGQLLTNQNKGLFTRVRPYVGAPL